MCPTIFIGPINLFFCMYISLRKLCQNTFSRIRTELWENTSQKKPVFWHILRSVYTDMVISTDKTNKLFE